MEIERYANQDRCTTSTIATANPVMTSAVIGIPYTDVGVVDRARGVEMDINVQSHFATSRGTRVDGRNDVSLTIVSYSRIRRNMTKPIGLHTVHVQRRWFKYISIESVIHSTDTHCFNTVFFVIHRYWPSTSSTSIVDADSHLKEIRTLVTTVRHRDTTW